MRNRFFEMDWQEKPILRVVGEQKPITQEEFALVVQEAQKLERFYNERDDKRIVIPIRRDAE